MPNPEHANSVVRQTEDYLAAIDRANPTLRAYTDVLTTQALTDAQATDANPTRPLHGLNIAIKNNIDTAGALCSAGLPYLRHRRATEDAAVVGLLRAAGAVILGVTATDSGAFGVTTPGVTNPTDPTRIAGGSSGGSAAAVAAGLCDAALGTDTGGSVRIPAACCGIYGFKPTHGVIPMAGIRPLTQRFDHVGVLAGSITEIRQITAVLAAQLPPAQSENTPCIAIPWPNLAGTDPMILDCLRNLQSNLRAKGFTVIQTTYPSLNDILEVHIGLSLAEAAALYTDLDAKTRQNLPEAMQAGLILGDALTPDQKSGLNTRRITLLAAIDRVFSMTDYLLLPTLPVLPPLVGQNTVTMGATTVETLQALIRFTAPFNQTGHPALAFPWPIGAEGPSFSLQLVGRHRADLSLLDFASHLLSESTSC
jgi:aspartyl-tRNA(Asn)/glutamyl-tRNA(Gln) amidotransferase subunit A